MALQEHINSHLLGKVNNKTILSQKIEKNRNHSC